MHNIRKIISDKIIDSSLFTLENGDKIEISDESRITLTDILIYNKKIYITSKIKKNTPISGPTLIENIGKLKIYKYPQIKLNDI